MQAPFQDHSAADRSIQALKAEYETDVHFQKCYGVMAELFQVHNNLEDVIPKSGFKFLDLGCAPGGFSSFLLDDPRCRTGFGVTLPSTCGGFPMRLRSNQFLLQQADLFEIGTDDLIASQVHVCICDAQYMRNNVAWDEKYRGVRCRSKQHGVWALLMKQFWLGLTRLLAGGILIFRFGWRDGPADDLATIWYKKMTIRLFSLLRDLFDEVKEVKSDHFNALQSSFYVCCTGFDPDKFADRQVAKLLGVNFNYLLTTRISDSNDLDLLAPVDKIRSEEVDKSISDMLDRVEKLRLVHEQSRKRHEMREMERDDPRAMVYIQPCSMSNEDLINAFSVFGTVKRVEREAADQACILFALVDQARSACQAMRGKGIFSEKIRIWMREEEVRHSPSDQWGGEWSATPWPGQQHGQAWVDPQSGQAHPTNGGYAAPKVEAAAGPNGKAAPAQKGGGKGRNGKGDAAAAKANGGTPGQNGQH